MSLIRTELEKALRRLEQAQQDVRHLKERMEPGQMPVNPLAMNARLDNLSYKLARAQHRVQEAVRAFGGGV